MNNFPKQEKVVDAILNGIVNAKNNFLFWTNDRLSLSYGPHKIVTIHIAQEIAKIEEHTPEIFINATVTDILRCSLPDRDEYPNFMTKGILQKVLLVLHLMKEFLIVATMTQFQE